MSVATTARSVLRDRVTVLGSVVAVETSAPVFVMTFDDGPDPAGTGRVLGALRRRAAHATFFMLSDRARRCPSLVRDVVAEGHEVGLHGIDHRALSTFTTAEVARRTADGRAALEDVAGVAIRWMRPPYGRQSPRTYLAVRRAGLMPVLWGGTSLDSAETTDAARVASALRAARPGLILLGHDGRAGLEDGVDDPPIGAFDRGALTARILEGFADRGLASTSLGRALEHGRARRGAWFG
jgi:peptidoglycan/xylan/chitin deacetylase (PgdA/CDA1 family)